LSTSAALINYSAFHALKMAFPIALYDEDAHITLKQGVLAAYGPGERHGFRNNDLASLERTLERLPAGPKLIVVDGVYSMKGTEAPVAAMMELCKRHEGTVFIDDVHGFGTRGPNGLGVIERITPEDRRYVLLLASFAKSASNPVAFLAYPKHLWAAVESIPALNYSGPPSNLHIAVCARHLAAFPAYATKRERLFAASRRVHAFCDALGVRTLSDTGSPIVSIGLKDDYMERAVEAFSDAGVLCKVAVFPVVRRGDEVLRCTLTAAHTDAQLDALEEAIEEIVCFLQTVDASAVNAA
jgi:8-amino-7-oxononanoate synthase